MEKLVSAQVHNLWASALKDLMLSSPDSILNNHIICASSEIVEQVLGDGTRLAKEIHSGAGYLMLKGCPIENHPDAPSSGDLTYSKLVLLGVSHWLGYNPFAFLQEKSGSIVHEIIPLKTKSRSISSNGIKEFGPHADGAYLPREVRPETLSLICLNTDARTDTRLVNIDMILDKMSRKDIELLMSPSFVHAPPETFEVQQSGSQSTSVIDCIDGRWEVKVATHSTRALSSEAGAALKSFTEIASKLSKSISWSPGDLLIFSNSRCLHSRGSIDGKRWLRRCYGSRRFKPCTVFDLLTETSVETKAIRKHCSADEATTGSYAVN